MNEQVKRSCIDAAAEIAWRQAAESNAETPWPYPEDAQFSHIICDGQQMARDDAQLWADRFAEAGYAIVPVAPDAGRGMPTREAIAAAIERVTTHPNRATRHLESFDAADAVIAILRRKSES